VILEDKISIGVSTSTPTKVRRGRREAVPKLAPDARPHDRQKLTKQNQQKPTKTNKNQQKPTKTNKNQQKPTKTLSHG